MPTLTDPPTLRNNQFDPQPKKPTRAALPHALRSSYTPATGLARVVEITRQFGEKILALQEVQSEARDEQSL